ncbi:MAG: hypothetical protein F6K25_12385 [Okeania sp. SIO2G4]|nr:hypothetical protein [Okeania sp. SIO2H7]NEP95228.1 hypothetical protein [Okeania sp. SIO2F5]NEQ91464.1 hypothetical protein [Okeania sp. SIO2G4]
MSRKYRPGIVLVNGGDGNNSSFLQELEQLELKYMIVLHSNGRIHIF